MGDRAFRAPGAISCTVQRLLAHREAEASDRGGRILAATKIDMNGKSVMITGATAGIGRAAAFALAEMGADLTIVCRNPSKGEETLAEIQRRYPKGAASMLVGDLGVQADIRRVASEFLATSKPLHVLFNNAGVIQRPYRVPDDHG